MKELLEQYTQEMATVEARILALGGTPPKRPGEEATNRLTMVQLKEKSGPHLAMLKDQVKKLEGGASPAMVARLEALIAETAQQKAQLSEQANLITGLRASLEESAALQTNFDGMQLRCKDLEAQLSTAKDDAAKAKQSEILTRETAARHGTPLPTKLDGSHADSARKEKAHASGSATGLQRAINAHKAE